MHLERIEAQKAFTIKFRDDEVFSIAFGADQFGYKSMQIIVDKKDVDGNFVESLTINYSWNPKVSETPAFAMDMMELMINMGKNAQAKKEGVVPDATAEEKV